MHRPTEKSEAEPFEEASGPGGHEIEFGHDNITANRQTDENIRPVEKWRRVLCVWSTLFLFFFPPFLFYFCIILLFRACFGCNSRSEASKWHVARMRVDPKYMRSLTVTFDCCRNVFWILFLFRVFTFFLKSNKYV